jgi:hypothetical protein
LKMPKRKTTPNLNSLERNTLKHVTQFLDKRSFQIYGYLILERKNIPRPTLTADLFKGIVCGCDYQIMEALENLGRRKEPISSKNLQSEIINIQSEKLSKLLAETEHQWNVIY